MSKQPQVPDEHYLWLGRVSSAFAMVDLQLGLVGHAASTGERYTDDWVQIAGKPGQAERLARSATRTLPSDLAEEVQQLLDEVKALRDERHRLAHSVFILDPESTGPSHPWVHRSPHGDERPTLDAEQGASLVVALNRAIRRASDLRQRVAAERQLGDTGNPGSAPVQPPR